MYSKMADWLEVFFPLCVCLFIFGYTSVVTTLDNVVMARNSGGTVSKLRFLTKEALKTGKIRINNCDNKNVNNGGNGSLSRIPAASRQRAAVQSPLGICDRVSRWQESPRSFHRDNDVSARNRTT